MKTCTVADCGRDTTKGTGGLCGMHTQRMKRTGTLGPAGYLRDPARSMEQRVFAQLVEQADTGCWLWQGALRNGYGAIGEGQAVVYVHRWVYEHLVADIPDGLVIDHLCLNRPCANPEHLEPVTRDVNNARGGHEHGARKAATA
ncbi:HNH endonuclease signature motif containing protein [Actinotalea sp. Marseille-Q4924]|uniref:HNH endonuclease signature motif containing protein n=1 Tax=Actinotalea sp. Marseille-Q4924 TaxID=2866571 RepID=UPI001CE441FD|nr:HNH endonuclease signature motif containing protein [Actinotalea sp. Marseille-Q4924]